MTNRSSTLWWTYILLLVRQSWHSAHYEWVLNCVATPEIVRGPALTIVLGPCVGGMGVKHGGPAYVMNGHGQN